MGDFDLVAAVTVDGTQLQDLPEMVADATKRAGDAATPIEISPDANSAYQQRRDAVSSLRELSREAGRVNPLAAMKADATYASSKDTAAYIASLKRIASGQAEVATELTASTSQVKRAMGTMEQLARLTGQYRLANYLGAGGKIMTKGIGAGLIGGVGMMAAGAGILGYAGKKTLETQGQRELSTWSGKRLGDSAVQQLDQLAKTTGFTRSEIQAAALSIKTFSDEVGVSQVQFQSLVGVLADMADAVPGYAGDLGRAGADLTALLRGGVSQELGINTTNEAMLKKDPNFLSLTAAQQTQKRLREVMEGLTALEVTGSAGENDLNKRLRELKSNLDRLYVSLGEAMLPTIEKIVDWLAKITPEQWEAAGKVLVQVGKLLLAIGAATTAVTVLGGVFRILSKIAGMGGLAKGAVAVAGEAGGGAAAAAAAPAAAAVAEAATGSFATGVGERVTANLAAKGIEKTFTKMLPGQGSQLAGRSAGMLLGGRGLGAAVAAGGGGVTGVIGALIPIVVAAVIAYGGFKIVQGLVQGSVESGKEGNYENAATKLLGTQSKLDALIYSVDNMKGLNEGLLPGGETNPINWGAKGILDLLQLTGAVPETTEKGELEKRKEGAKKWNDLQAEQAAGLGLQQFEGQDTSMSLFLWKNAEKIQEQKRAGTWHPGGVPGPSGAGFYADSGEEFAPDYVEPGAVKTVWMGDKAFTGTASEYEAEWIRRQSEQGNMDEAGAVQTPAEPLKVEITNPPEQQQVQLNVDVYNSAPGVDVEVATPEYGVDE